MKPTVDELARFSTVVAARLGLHVDLERAGELVERRAQAVRERVAAYLDRIDADPAELQLVANELTVGETYLFRHIEQFRAFADVVVPDRLAHGRLRVLSAGCSSGEEPYTLAILLRESHPGLSFTIQACDVNASAIARARAGRYSRWSLRATPPEIERRWFQPEGRDVIVAPELRAVVKFDVANLLDDAVLGGAMQWDVVFCRNMIMYFTETGSERVISRLTRSIASGGYLFLGHAETLRGRATEFALCHSHGAFYYQRQPATASAPVFENAYRALPIAAAPLDTEWYGDILAATQRVHALVDTALHAAGVTQVAQPGRESPAALPDLAAIRDLLAQERFTEALDRLEQLRAVWASDHDIATLRALVLTHSGQFAEARAACDELLAIDPASAGARYLLALCCDSTGDTEGAARLAQLAADLDPSFAMPRVHLGLLARRLGAHRIASRELARAIALLEREAPARLELYGGGFSRHALLAMCQAELDAIGAAR